MCFVPSKLRRSCLATSSNYLQLTCYINVILRKEPVHSNRLFLSSIIIDQFSWHIFEEINLPNYLYIPFIQGKQSIDIPWMMNIPEDKFASFVISTKFVQFTHRYSDCTKTIKINIIFLLFSLRPQSWFNNHFLWYQV